MGINIESETPYKPEEAVILFFHGIEEMDDGEGGKKDHPDRFLVFEHQVLTNTYNQCADNSALEFRVRNVLNRRKIPWAYEGAAAGNYNGYGRRTN
jgi:hypothetical protein